LRRVNLSPQNHTAEDVIRLLGLEPLPREGGYYRRTFASSPAFSVIHYLVTPNSFSALHRLKAGEIWCLQAGDPVDQLRLFPDGRCEWVTIGAGVGSDQQLQAMVPAGVWQGTRLAAGGRWALLACVCVPEYVEADFELADVLELTAAHPDLAADIARLNRGTE
jgi:predicted cupin superfamily sugar epimerase